MTSSAAPPADALAALAPKLQHALPKIRARALASLLFKLRERLADVRALERDRAAAAALTSALVACCVEPALETDALAALELLLAEDAPVLRACLQSSGAAVPLQRAAMGRSSALQAAYEKLIHLIYATPASRDAGDAQSSSSSSARLRPTPLSTDPETALHWPVEHQQLQHQQLQQHQHQHQSGGGALVVAASRRAHAPVALPELATRGWRFPAVALSSADEQFLFEFEVALQLRTSAPELVRCCQRVRDELLRNFPVELFLQRPAVLQHLLHLAQQPLLATRGDATADALALGVNYFDDLGSASFSPKPSSLAAAVFVAAARALEAVVYALRRAAKARLDPVFLAHASVLDGGVAHAYDARRTFFPRAQQPGSRTARDAGSQFSLGGAVFALFSSLLPLLASPLHPRLHVLNVLHLALPLLPEKNGDGALDAARIEHILALLGDLCFPAVRDVAQILADYAHCVTWRVLELLVRLLQLHPPSSYQVTPAASATAASALTSPLAGAEAPGDGDAATRLRIRVPRNVWRFVLTCAASAGFEDLARSEWHVGDVVGFLSAIDGSVASFLDARRAVQSTRSALNEFLGLATQLSELSGSSSSQAAAVAAQMRLEVALKAAHALEQMRAQETPAAVDGILLATWSALLRGGSSNEPTEPDVGRMREIVRTIVGRSLRDTRRTAALASARLCSQLAAVLASGESAIGAVPSEYRRQFVVRVLGDSQVFRCLLLRGAALSEGQNGSSSDDLWALLALLVAELSRLPESELGGVAPVIPLLQHFAFLEPTERVSPALRSVQPQVVELVNRAERSLPAAARLLLIARCLLHASAFIRRAAASGVLSLLAEANPGAFRRLAENSVGGGDEVLLEDPFGAPAGGADELQPLERSLRAAALPSTPSDPSASEARTSVSPSLAKLSALRRVLAATSSSLPSVKETAIRELMLMVDDLPPPQFELLEELGEVANVKALLLENLRAAAECQFDADGGGAFAEMLLLFLRNLLRRSSQLRRAMRGDERELTALLPFVFDSRAVVRAQMFYVLLLLTLTGESFAPPVAASTSDSDNAVPEFVVATFGLHAQSWGRCGIRTCALAAMVEGETAQASDVGSPDGADGAVHQASLAASPDVELVLQRLQAAKSHARFLNALYHLLQLAEASETARARLGASWEQIFARFVAVAPQGERDEVAVGAVLSCLTALVGGMAREGQLRLLQVVKRAFVPLLQGATSAGFAAQLMRLLVRLSASRVADLFPTLAVDTNLLDVLCAKYVPLYAAHPVLHALTLELVLRFATSDTSGAASAQLYSDATDRRLLSLVSPLLAIVCRHRVPGSFLDRDVFAVAAQALAAIVARTPRATLLGDGAGRIAASDQSLLVDNAWASRLLFDHCSQLRALGFAVLASSVAIAPADVETRLLQLAVDTSVDASECDAVRGAACGAIHAALLRFKDVGDARRGQLTSILGGDALAGNLLRALCRSREDDRLLVTCALHLSRLLRLLLVRRSALAAHFGDPVRALAAAADAFDVYPALVQMLSLRAWEDAFERSCGRYLHLRPADARVWGGAVLPVVLQLLRELLMLVTTILQLCERSVADFLLTQTTLLHQLLELLGDLSASLKATTKEETAASSQLHYDALEMCAACLSAAAAHATSSRGAALVAASAMRSAWSQPAQVETLAFLAAPQHPTRFRVSFARVVVAMLAQADRQLASESAAARALCSSLFDLYSECAELRRVDASSSAAEAAAGVAALRRVTMALKVLLESSAALRHLAVVVKRGVHVCSGALKEALYAVRMAGGFGGKGREDALLVALCERAAIHLDVLAALVGGDREAQATAMRERVGDVIAGNWTTMRMAAARGSPVLLAALRFANNVAFANDAAKAAFVASGATTESSSAAPERLRPLFALLAQLVLPRESGAPPPKAPPAAVKARALLSATASAVLKSLVTNAECLQWAIKSGFVAKLVDDVQRRLRAAAQMSKSEPLELATLGDLLGVLAGVASSDDGRQAVYASAEMTLVHMVADILRSSEANAPVLRHGSLFVRNLSLSRLSRSYLAVWEPSLDLVLRRLLQVLATGDAEVARLLSCALWSLVFEVQKARPLLLSKPAVVRKLEQAREAAAGDETAGNLERALFLVQQPPQVEAVAATG